jgi:hypothetical protein
MGEDLVDAHVAGSHCTDGEGQDCQCDSGGGAANLFVVMGQGRSPELRLRTSASAERPAQKGRP